MVEKKEKEQEWEAPSGFTKHEWTILVRTWQEEPREYDEAPPRFTTEYIASVVARYPRCFKAYLTLQEEKNAS